jgi:hypothetical protein
MRLRKEKLLRYSSFDVCRQVEQAVQWPENETMTQLSFVIGGARSKNSCRSCKLQVVWEGNRCHSQYRQIAYLAVRKRLDIFPDGVSAYSSVVTHSDENHHIFALAETCDERGRIKSIAVPTRSL